MRSASLSYLVVGAGRRWGMGMNEKPLTFLASIAPLQSAMTISSDGGARVKIDIPESEMPAIVRLMLYRGKRLRITLEIDNDGREEDTNRYFTS